MILDLSRVFFLLSESLMSGFGLGFFCLNFIGLVLLCLETKNDYVRFHAWQSTLIFTCALLLHLLFVFSKFLSILLFLADIGVICFLA